MIAGNDERIMLVVETDARLDGIRRARTEIRGLRTDVAATAPAAATAAQAARGVGTSFEGMSDVSRAAFDRMNASQQQAFVKLMGWAPAQRVAAAATTQTTRSFEVQRGIVMAHMEAMRQNTAAVTQNAQSQNRHAAQLNVVNPRVRTAANATAILTGSLLGAGGGMRGTAIAAGSLAFSISMLSTSARIAASAAGIGAIVTIALTLVTVLRAAKNEAGALSDVFRERMGFLAAGNAQRMLADAAAARDRAVAEAAARATGDIRDLMPWTVSGRAQQAAMDAIQSYRELFIAVQRVQQAERVRVQNAIISSREEITQRRTEIELLERRTMIGFGGVATAGGRRIPGETERSVRRAELRAEEEAGRRRIEQSFRIMDANGQVITLTAVQIHQQAELIRQNTQLAELKNFQLVREERMADLAYRRATFGIDPRNTENVRATYEERRRIIEDEALEDLKRGQNRVDVEARTEAQIRALRRDTYRAAIANARDFETVLLSSRSRQSRAIGHAMQTVRRIVLGYEAAEAGIHAIKEAAAAIAAAARMKWAQAALHTAASIKFAAVSAAAAQEAGGGGGRSGGGGAGGGAGGGTTFEPRTASEGAGVVVLQIIAQNPLGPERVRQLNYTLQRGGVLKLGTELPTNDITVRALP